MITPSMMLATVAGLTAVAPASEAVDPDAPTVDEAAPSDAAAAGDTTDDAVPEAAEEVPPPPSPGTIPTDGPTKRGPSPGALARESPLEQPDPTPRDRAGRPGSPQRFALEIKLGPFLPDVDRNYQGPGFGPYASIFGRTDQTGAAIDEPRPFVMPQVGFDWQFLYLAGPLGVGAQLGFFRDKARALITQPLDPEDLRSKADDTTFTIVPLAVLLSYRFELLADRYRVPLVPYAKGGLAYSLYWVRAGSGNLARNSRGEAAFGGIPGWQLNLGGMFRLDVLEPGTAKKLDNLTGINHTYLFGEYQISRVDSFGVGNSMSLGDNTWFVGLAVEF